MNDMNTCDDVNEFRKFLSIQAEEMCKHKWIESEKVGYDLGNAAIQDWVKKYAKEFREFYYRKEATQQSPENQQKSQ